MKFYIAYIIDYAPVMKTKCHNRREFNNKRPQKSKSISAFLI